MGDYDYMSDVEEQELLRRAQSRINKAKKLTSKEVCDLLGVSRMTLNRYVRDGLLTEDKNDITKRVRYDHAEVLALKNKREDIAQQ